MNKVIIRGLLGIGKSTISKKVENIGVKYISNLRGECI